MNINDLKKKFKEIDELKQKNNYENFSLEQLKNLPTFSGICELIFKKNKFYMINISNDDGIVLKYLWRNKYENLSLNLWYKITRKNGYFFDIGSHTGIYSIVGNLNKDQNNVISIEPYFLNYSRLLSNLRLNNIKTNNCFLGAASNSEGLAKFKIKTGNSYHASGGKISDDGNQNVNKIKIDNFKLDKKIDGIKIDTEGHEFEVIEGARNYIDKYKPEIIFEINENSFNKCLALLSINKYNFYFIDEVKEKIKKVERFSSNLKQPEGSNCYATIDSL